MDKDNYNFQVRLDFDTYKNFKIYCLENKLFMREAVVIAIKKLIKA